MQCQEPIGGAARLEPRGVRSQAKPGNDSERSLPARLLGYESPVSQRPKFKRGFSLGRWTKLPIGADWRGRK